MNHLIKFLFLSLFFISYPLSAITLGEVKVNSYINQPLNADIKVLLLENDSDGLKIKAFLASKDDFIKFDIERSDFLNDIRFVTYKKSNGETVINLSTQKIIREPLLSLIVKIITVEGNLSREYNLFLNPPPETQIAQILKSSAEQLQHNNDVNNMDVNNKDIIAGEKVEEKKNKSQSNLSDTGNNSYRPDLNYDIANYTIDESYGPTKAGQTITLIAQQIRPDKTYSIQKIAKLLFQINPNAFINKNINRLKKSFTLRLPDLVNSDFRKDSYAHIDNDAERSQVRPAPLSEQKSKSSDSSLHKDEVLKDEVQQPNSELKLVSGDYTSLNTSELIKVLDVTDDSLQAQELLNLSIEKMQILKEENQTLRDQFGIIMIRMEEIVIKNEQLDKELVKLNSLAQPEQISNQKIAEVAEINEVQEVPEIQKTAEISETKTAEISNDTLVEAESTVKNKSDNTLVSASTNTLAINKSTSKFYEIDWYFWAKMVFLIVLAVLIFLTIWVKFFQNKKELTPEEFSMDEALDDVENMDSTSSNANATLQDKKLPKNKTDETKTEENIDFELDLDDSNLNSEDYANNDFNAMQVSQSQVSAISPAVTADKSANKDTPSSINFNDILAPSKPSKVNENVDLISQSSVYFAYGKFDLAEQLLNDAISSDPANTKLQLKLFECYAKMDNEEKFLNHLEQAKDLYTNSAEFKSDINNLYNKQWDKELF